MPPADSLPGWFGKIPALGDFVTRRLPAAFVQAWDDWLSGEIVGAQQLLGEDWPRIYGQGPCWCFALAPGTLDANRWTGVLVPSADRVGRRFPLTIAMAGEVPAAVALQRWAAMTETALHALDPDCDAQGVDAALAAALQQCSAPGGADASTWAGLDGAMHRARGAGSLWWRWPDAQQGGEPPSFAAPRLPRGDDFLRLYR